MATATATPLETFTTALATAFARSSDGFWYPQAEGTALVRIELSGSTYRIYRRRDAECEWAQLVVSRLEEFDSSTFTTWASQWRLVA